MQLEFHVTLLVQILLVSTNWFIPTIILVRAVPKVLKTGQLGFGGVLVLSICFANFMLKNNLFQLSGRF